MPKFDGNEGGPIELGTAAKWTKNYRDGKDTDAADGIKIKAHFFGRKILKDILEQPGCMGIRMYYAKNEAGQRQLVLVGATAEGEDMTDGIVADNSTFCPPDCVQSELNS